MLSLVANICFGEASILDIIHSFTNCLSANTYKSSATVSCERYNLPVFVETSFVPKNTIPSVAEILCTSSKGTFV